MAASGALHLESRLGVLDGLRGLAVLLVLWYHVWEISWWSPPRWIAFLPPTGFVGVHLFFFLSGFVISYPFVRAVVFGAPQPTWGDFAWRRFIKIVPSYLLAVAVAYGIGYAQVQPNASTVPDLVTHLLFIHTWFPLRFGTIAGVLWTLAVEVEFYCAFPLLWWCFRRNPWITAGAMIVAAWAWRAALAGCCFSSVFPQYEENLPGYLDLFAFGMIAAYVFTRWGAEWRASGYRYAAPFVAIGGFAILGALLRNFYAYRLHVQWAGVWQIDHRPWLGLAFAIIALASLASPRWWQIVLDNPPLRFLAAISYNLYLYHQLVARELLWHHVPPYAGDPHRNRHWQIGYTAIAVTLALAQAALVTYWYERPLLRLRAPVRNVAALREL
jgi:peptidoglycan/LPS O-acetylase OafA/YrhL